MKMASGDFWKKIFGDDQKDRNINSRHPRNDFGQSGLPRNIEDDLLNHENRNPPQHFTFHFTTPDDLLQVEEQMFKQLDDMMGFIFQGFHIQGVFPGQHQFEEHKDKHCDGKALRDKMLKDPSEDDGMQIFNMEPFDEDNKRSAPWFRPPSLFEELFKYPFHDAPQEPNLNHEIDSDLDDEILSGRSKLDDIFKSEQPEREIEDKPWTGSSLFFWSSSSTTTTSPNGGVESRKTVRDSKGNEEVTVTRQLGDQSHSYTKRIDSTGVKETKEDFINMDETDFKTFEEKWQGNQKKDIPMLLFEPDGKDRERPNYPGGLYDIFKDFLFPWRSK